MIYLVAKKNKVIAAVTNKLKAYSLLEQEIGEFSPSYTTFSKRITDYGETEVDNYKVKGIEVQ